MISFSLVGLDVLKLRKYIYLVFSCLIKVLSVHFSNIYLEYSKQFGKFRVW